MAASVEVATRKGLFSLVKAGSRWEIRRSSFVGDPVSIVGVDPRDGAYYAFLDHGHFGSKLHRSEDRGASWTELASPAYPPRPEGAPEELLPWSSKPWPWSVKKVWSFAAGGPEQPGRLWCGTIPGGLFRSDDRGGSWELVRSLWEHPKRKQWFGGGADFPGIHSICVDPRDARRVVVGVSCGGVWMSEDDGQSWALCASGMRAEYMPEEQQYDPNAQDPHCVVQCRAAPDHFWCQHHNGVFRSTDGCASWQEIATVPPSTFGFAVAVHPHDPQQAWFVPAIKDEKRVPVDAQVVVARTRDGAQSFDVLREGLPQEHAYDLVYRHALDIRADGQALAFGSTTGSLWISENQGDAWQLVSSHLPPIYCVRWA